MALGRATLPVLQNACEAREVRSVRTDPALSVQHGIRISPSFLVHTGNPVSLKVFTLDWMSEAVAASLNN